LRWKENINMLEEPISALLSDWVTKPYILSQELKRHYQLVQVDIIAEGYATPYEDEAKCLGISNESAESAWVRRVFLIGDNLPRTYGRVVIPQQIYQKYQSQFCQLGNKLLGETLLYHNPQVTRKPFEYGQIDASCPLAEDVKAKNFITQDHKNNLPARRSLFLNQGVPFLLLTEVFLTTLAPYHPCC
jgi:chorismate-pyruvate lyase